MAEQKQAIKEQSFKECTLKYLDKTFGLEQVKTLSALEQWLTMPADISEIERHHLIHMRNVLEFNVHDWNEHELDSRFIGPLFTLVDYSSNKFNHFAQREFEGMVEDVRLFGRPDGVIASGRREPEKPFFAFQEYKRRLDPNGDPAGQALAAMLVGQSMDEVPKPLYGCYVIGQVWQFILLEGKQYAISQDFSAITDEIFDIFRILKALKQIVIELTAE
ncbi:MAG: hypothetical protein AAF702_33330 [Chloroflexota bacterium]